MRYEYKPSDVCARSISFDFEDGIVSNVSFMGGCDGNHKGLCALVEGMPAEKVCERLSGITCGMRATSCPDQLSKALENVMKEAGIK